MAETVGTRARRSMLTLLLRLALAGGVAFAAVPLALAANPTFTELLSRAEKQAAEGKRWSPPGDNMTETIASMMDILSTATPKQLNELSALLENDASRAPPPPARATLAPAPQSAEPAQASEPPAAQPSEPAQANIAPAAQPPEPAQTSIAPAAQPAEPAQASEPPARQPPEPAQANIAPAAQPPEPARPAVSPARQPPEPAQANIAPAAQPPEPTRPAVSPAPPPAAPAQASIAPAAQPPEPTRPTVSPARRPPEPAQATIPDSAIPKQTKLNPPKSDVRAAVLFARGLEAEQQGNVSGARRFYTSAAELGSASAALNLGRLYDPAYLKQTALGGIDPDPALARHWYGRAVAMGDVAAIPLLEALALR
jgi:TPR repeat protein